MAYKRKRMLGRAVTCGRKRKQQKGETNNVRDWAGLHDYLLEDVMGRLPLADCLSFGGVCKPWQSVAAEYLDGCDRRVPCLVKRGQNEVTARSCINILGNSKFEMDLPEAYGSCVWGSFQDWLFLGRREKTHLRISLLNSFTGENVLLPLISMSIYHSMVVSAVPSDENFVCMLVGAAGIVAFWTPGVRKWHEIDFLTLYFLDVLYCRGYFYLLDDDDTIFVIDVKNVISVLKNKSGAGASISTRSFLVKLPNAPKSQSARHYLVESGGEMLLVCRFFYRDDARFYETSAFETYRLDLQKMAWLKLENLDDQIIFVGNCCSRSFHAKDLGETLSNNIYFINEGPFTDVNEWIHNDNKSIVIGTDYCGVFSFQKPNHWPSAFRERAKHWVGVWLTVPIGWCLKQRRAS